MPPAIARYIYKCTGYSCRALVLLAILAEAYSFISPASYHASYTALRASRDESFLWFLLELLKEMLRLLFKVFNFSICVEYALFVCNSHWGTVEIDTPREWGGAVYLKLPWGVYAFRCALARNSWVGRWYIWYSDTVNRVMDSWLI